MAYLKSAPYPVPGLGLHGLPVDSLHSSMAGYPGGKVLLLIFVCYIILIAISPSFLKAAINNQNILTGSAVAIVPSAPRASYLFTTL